MRALTPFIFQVAIFMKTKRIIQANLDGAGGDTG
jgi:hypothetical protein